MTIKDIPPYRLPTLILQEDGSYLAQWPLQKRRFLFSDGRTVDVVSSRDDSDLRAVLLHVLKAERIEGVASLVEPVEETPPPPRRAVRKRPAK